MTTVSETDDHVVLHVETPKGGSYEMGFPKSEGYAANTILAEMNKADATESYKELNWVPGQQGYTSSQAEDIGIAQGYVSNDRGVIYKYRINFQNSKGWSFKFKDESGDEYKCMTIRNGWHYIDYNSEKPTIIGVK